VNWFKCSHADEVEALKRRYADVETRLLRLELSEKAFRDKVLRKVQKPKNGEEEEISEEPEDLKSKMLLPV